MNSIENCTYYKAQYLYVTNPMWSHAPRTSFSRHNLIFVTDGVLYIEQDGTRYEARAGQCLFLERGHTSTGYRPSGGRTGFYYAIFNCPGSPPPFPRCFTPEEPKNVRELFAQLVSRVGYGDYPRPAMDTLLRSLFYEVLYQSGPHPTAATSLGKSIKSYVHGSSHRNITVNDIALHFGFCPDYVSREFYKSEHIHLKKYITDVRIRRIEELLSSANHTIQTTSETMGFQSVSALCKFYKYHTGLSPSEYRRRFYSPESSSEQSE